MRSKRWVKGWLLFFGIIPIVAVINFAVDPFSVFQTHVLKRDFQINERFLKIRYLENHHQKFDSYMFGSSRIATTEPAVIEKYLPGAHFYNMTCADANLYDYLLHLKYFLKEHYKIKNIYMQIDIGDMFSYGQNGSDYMRKFHPDVTGGSLTRFYVGYLLGYFPQNVIGKIEQNIEKRNGYEYHWDRGTWSEPEKEKEILEDCSEYVLHEPTFHAKQKRMKRFSTIDKSIQALKEICDLCDKNGIKLYLFTTPHNKNMMDSFDTEDYLTFLTRLAEVRDYYDFSGYNTVTLDDCNHYESSHYRPIVGQMIAARIFRDTTVPLPADFGFLVTKRSVDGHIEKLRKQIENYDRSRLEKR